jgi:hypothetical protein
MRDEGGVVAATLKNRGQTDPGINGERSRKERSGGEEVG